MVGVPSIFVELINVLKRVHGAYSRVFIQNAVTSWGGSVGRPLPFWLGVCIQASHTLTIIPLRA